MNPEIHKFLKELLAEAGQKDLTPELEEAMIQDLSTRLEDRLTLAAVEKLSPEKQEELGKLAETKPDATAVMSFLKKNIPDYDDVFAQALESFREVYLGAQG